MSQMDKINGLKEILELDPGSSFARYGIAMERLRRGEVAEALADFDILLANDPEAIERLKVGISCAARRGNRHALSEMQTMLDELER